MSKWLYDPKTDERNGKEFEYNLPIHENDTLLYGFSYREVQIILTQLKNLVMSDINIMEQILSIRELSLQN